MHRKEPAAESIEQLTEESDRNQPTVDLADRRRAGTLTGGGRGSILKSQNQQQAVRRGGIPGNIQLSSCRHRAQRRSATPIMMATLSFLAAWLACRAVVAAVAFSTPVPVPAALSCPASSCWCHDTFPLSDVQLHSQIYYRTAYNYLTHSNQTLYLDEWVVPVPTKRPGALIIHGGGYSSGPYNGCSHARNMTKFANVATALARRGFAVVSIDYRCEGALRRNGSEFRPVSPRQRCVCVSSVGHLNKLRTYFTPNACAVV
jgi:hypothetical protein